VCSGLLPPSLSSSFSSVSAGLTRDKLPLRVAEAQVQDLVKPSSTNGRVEPQHIFEAHAPEATTIKNVYVHVGEQVRPGSCW
jgi:multidrug efflux pump subunit AcrA (membrane-fusion protein)